MSENSESPSTEVVHHPHRHRYVLLADGRELGFTQYIDSGDDRVFVHTEIDPAEEGHGYGSTLIRGSLQQVREEGLRIAATCPFVTAWLEKHHDFDDIVDPVSIEMRASLRE